jgi:hypothetical protein
MGGVSNGKIPCKGKYLVLPYSRLGRHGSSSQCCVITLSRLADVPAQMALNLRKKTSPSVPLYVYDVCEPNMHKFAEMGRQFGKTVICGSPKEVAEHSVSRRAVSLLLEVIKG